MTNIQLSTIVYLLIFLAILQIFILFRLTQIYWTVRPEFWRPRRMKDLSESANIQDELNAKEAEEKNEKP